jgi:broad specificity phosphatase PhoE
VTTTTLDYLRHGEPIGGSRFRGNGVDDPLSDLGWSQMRATSDALSGWEQVIASPMQRCRAFAEQLAEARDLPLTVIEDLREVGFGSWEGRDREVLRRDHTSEYEAFYRDPVNNRPADAEPLADFGIRVAAVFDHLVQRFSGQHLLVVAHAGVIRATLGHVTQSPAQAWYRANVDHAAMSRFVHDRLGPSLVFHNWRPRP